MRPLLLGLFAPGRADVDALAVTNAAAALLLALDTVANGKRVAVSRGELVAIGGDFRVPSILAKSGASLHEVGTTNRTTVDDYAEALDAGAAAILKVRPSNYRIVGFTEEVALASLAALAHERGVPLVFDAGAGAPRRFAEPGLAGEPVPAEALDEGADLVCFSGDKILGGPQAGILIGRADLVARASKNPLARALEARQARSRRPGRDARPPPVRAERRGPVLPDGLGVSRFPAAPCRGPGGESPRGGARGRGRRVDGRRGRRCGGRVHTALRAVALRRPGISADALLAALRSRPLPVVARIEEGRVLLDLRSVAEEEDADLAAVFETGSLPTPP